LRRLDWMTLKQMYRDASLSTAARVADLLASMTIEEKANQIAAIWISDVIDKQSRFVPEMAAAQLAYGIGHISRLGAVSMLAPQDSVKLANQIQHFLVENTRLGIPAIMHEESCAGYLAKGATTFPQAIGLAATWQPELVQQMADAIRREMRAVGAHLTLAPVVDVARDPRWGRMEETFGEDPYLISQIGNAYIKGMQGDSLTTGIVATAKHFLGYALSEGGLNWAPAHIPEREMLEIFATPFAAAIQEAHVGAVMNAYQELDGEPAGSSRRIMHELLREKLGFNGTVVSDYFTVDMFMTYHKIADNKIDAARFGLEAGVDVELPGRDCYGQPLIDALHAGTIDIALVDACVERVLTQKFELGLFDNPYVDEGAVAAIYNNPPLELSRTLAAQSIVLLKNDGLLPLKKGIDKIAVIGPHADSIKLMQGDYHYPSHMMGILSLAEGMDAPAPDEERKVVNWDEHFPPTTTFYRGIQTLAGESSEIAYAQGCDVMSMDKSGFGAAVSLATEADVAVIVVGDKSGLGRDNTTGEARDRASLDLPGVQQDLIEAVHATGTPTVVVLMTGRPYAINWIHEHIPSVLEVWLPAQEGGAAIAEVLFGEVNPGGKLPVSFPRSEGQIPVYYNHKPSGQRSHWHGEYVDMPTKPLYPFGHGLSYTSFDYSNFRISALEVTASDRVQISFNVTNSGAVAGDEIVQLYLGDPIATVTRPVKALKGFKRLHLQAGECKTVTFDVDVRHMAFYDRSMNYVVEPGKITVMVGASSADIRLTGEFSVVGATTSVAQVFTTPVTVS
jgi:beta-glucosidase